MKLVFSILFVCIYLSTAPYAKELSSEFVIKTKGIKIGVLFWDIEITNNIYRISIDLKSEGPFSWLYQFKGSYDVKGKIINKEMLPLEYNQSWTTKNKNRNVKIIFKNFKINDLIIDPEEIEKPRIEYKNLESPS